LRKGVCVRRLETKRLPQPPRLVFPYSGERRLAGCDSGAGPLVHGWILVPSPQALESPATLRI
jgi:hypothetical protein